MQNEQLFAFYPSDYDPRKDPTFQLDNGKYDSVIDLEERLDKIPYAPASERPAFDILFRALREWWRGHEDELDNYDDFTQDMLSIGDNYYKDGNSNYFKLRSTPPSEYVDWFLMMVNVANDNGLIVFSTPDYALYYPDRTSTPSNAREWLEQYVAEQTQPSKFTLETIASIMEAEKNQKQNQLSPYLDSNKNVKSFVMLLLQDFLERNKIYDVNWIVNDYKRILIDFGWVDNTVLKLDFKSFILNDRVVFHPSFIVSHKVATDHPTYPSFSFNKTSYDMRLLELSLPKAIQKQGHTSLEFQQTMERLETKRQIFSVTQLYQAVNEFLEIVQQEILAYDSFYDMVNAIIIGRSKALHKYILQLRPIYDFEIYKIIIATRHIQHPKLQEVLDKGLAILAEHNMKLSEPFQEQIDKIMDGYEPNTAN